MKKREKKLFNDEDAGSNKHDVGENDGKISVIIERKFLSLI